MTLGYDPNIRLLGGFSKYDGTIEFYGRIRSVLTKDSIVLDYGAGRAAWFVEGPDTYSRKVRSLKSDVGKLMLAILTRRCSITPRRTKPFSWTTDVCRSSSALGNP